MRGRLRQLEPDLEWVCGHGRDVLDRDGLTPWYDEIVLSYEVGVVKPDTRIFAAALDRLSLPASDVLMVGDNANDDGGGTHLGLRTLILPRTSGRVHGLSAVTALVTGPRPLSPNRAPHWPSARRESGKLLSSRFRLP